MNVSFNTQNHSAQNTNFGMKKFNMLATKAEKATEKLTKEQREILQDKFDKIDRQVKLNHHKAVSTLKSPFKKIYDVFGGN